MTRLSETFDRLRASGRKAFIPFIMAGDPDGPTSEALLSALPGAGADVVELGFPFTDPMADGPVIAEAGQRALRGGQTLRRTLDMVRRFRAAGHGTPLVLMGYANPVLQYGEGFARDAVEAGVDGLILVDLPPEESRVLAGNARQAGLDLIRLATPTTREARIDKVLDGASGFLYYVAVAGVTGGRSATAEELGRAIGRLKERTALPVAAGFGIRDPEGASAAAEHADAVVVGSAIVKKLQLDGVGGALDLARTLADAVHGAEDGAEAALSGKAL